MAGQTFLIIFLMPPALRIKNFPYSDASISFFTSKHTEALHIFTLKKMQQVMQHEGNHSHHETVAVGL